MLPLAALVLAATPHAGPAAEKAGLVVVAPEAWVAALAPWIEARKSEFAVEVVVLERLAEAARGPEGGDAPERIKRHLYEAWRERGARYVLLVGDADRMPVRFMVLDRRVEPAFHYAFYPSDLYYADVAREDGSFDDWNAARDGFHARYFGEVRGEHNKDDRINFDRVSYVPELAVGRWPVTDEAQLAAVVAKTVAWRAHAEPGVLWVHADEWVDARPRVGVLADELQSRGFRTERMLYGDDGGPTPPRVRAALERGFTLALHVGHGTNEGWHRCLGPAERDALGAAPPAIYLSVGCSTAHLCNEPPYHAYLDADGGEHAGTDHGEVFDAPPPPPACLQPGRYNTTGLGERLIAQPGGGAVVYIGCVTGAQPCALSLLDGFAHAVAADPGTRVGDAWRAALAHYHAAERLDALVPTDSWYPASIFFQGMKFALFGDPTLQIASPASDDRK